MSFYRRHLPHWQPPGKALFITWSLHDPEAHWLRQPEIARIIVDAIHFGAERLGRYDLHAFVVMSNHIHILVHPHVEAAVILKNLKGITARRSNAVLGRVGKIFWLDESFDHWIRTDIEFAETKEYIEGNPVRAGVVLRAQDYPWSSAYRPGSGLEA
ncbi:MAG TPA: transposase [Bryobacteraceae bacterium]|nr:transposase [Bryobacteraceae bacterium]